MPQSYQICDPHLHAGRICSISNLYRARPGLPAVPAVSTQYRKQD